MILPSSYPEKSEIARLTAAYQHLLASVNTMMTG